MDGAWGRAAGVALLLGAAVGCGHSREAGGGPASSAAEGGWLSAFDTKACTWSSVGKNTYFILEPGYQLVLGGGSEQLFVTVLKETEMVDGVETRVVEEREFVEGKLKEVSRNYFAICKEHRDVFYFGEDVDDYKGGKVVGHGGAWRAGRKGAQAGLMMPGKPRVGLRHYQEIAPGQAMDRAEVQQMDATIETPAGAFKDCLKAAETTPLEPGDVSIKVYAPGIGIVRDDKLTLMRRGQAADGPIEPLDSARDEKSAEKEGDELGEVEIKFEDMPPELAKKVRELHPTGTIKEVKRETHAGGKIIYALEVMVGGQQYDVEVTERGKVIRNKAE